MEGIGVGGRIVEN